MNSIKIKLVVIYAFVILVVMTVSGTIMLLTVRDMEEGLTHERLRDLAVRIDQEIIQVYEVEQFLHAGVWRILGQSEYDIESLILNAIGVPIAPFEFARPGMTFNDRAVVSAVRGEEYFFVGSIGVDRWGNEREWLSFAMPVNRAGEDFIVYTRVNAQFLNESLSMLTFNLLVMIVIALVLTIVFWFFLANTITNPIVALTRHAKAIASGDFTVEIKQRGKDEIGQLAHNFDIMAKELQVTLGNMSSEKNKREAILQNTPDGVLAYDAAGRLIHANTASAALLHGVDLNSSPLRETLTLLGFNPDDVDLLQPGEVNESIYEDKDFIISATATPYTRESGEVDGYVILLQDVSRQRKLDNMRKEFVANVSHELRTPLTNVCTYTETLLGGAVEDVDTALKFLKVIDDEARRMSLLVSDLLELSRIDSSQTALEMDVVDLVAMLRLAVRQIKLSADKKRQIIEFSPPPQPCFIEANAARVNQVVSNVLSNSIKYSGENTVISIRMETTEKFYRVFITDQGIGIPPESISRVFERFYRVDKARARAMGGTGLGLAIVKEIMEEHGGSVYITSQPGKGTILTLRFNRLNE